MKSSFFILLFLLSFSLFPQEYILQIVNTHSGRYKLLNQGSILKIKTKEGEKVRGVFEYFTDSAIFFTNGSYIAKNQINTIGFYRKYWYFLAGKSLMFSIAYLGIASGNRILNNSSPPFLRESDFLISGIIFSIGLISKSLSIRNYHIEKDKWRVKYIKR